MAVCEHSQNRNKLTVLKTGCMMSHVLSPMPHPKVGPRQGESRDTPAGGLTESSGDQAEEIEWSVEAGMPNADLACIRHAHTHTHTRRFEIISL